MKGDLGEEMGPAGESYAGVRMQPGRVLLDEDWHEKGSLSGELCRRLGRVVGLLVLFLWVFCRGRRGKRPGAGGAGKAGS